MVPVQRKLIAGIACAAVLGVAAFVFLSGGKPDGPAMPVVEQSEPAPAANVGDITPPAVSAPGAADSVSPQPESDVPAFDPEGGDTDVSVPFIPEVTKPPEAETDPNPETHERVENENPDEPPATEPPRQPVTPDPPRQTGPQAGDTNTQGQVWVPGFGWVTPGNGNQGRTSGSDGDINKQVGDM